MRPKGLPCGHFIKVFWWQDTIIPATAGPLSNTPHITGWQAGNLHNCNCLPITSWVCGLDVLIVKFHCSANTFIYIFYRVKLWPIITHNLFWNIKLCTNMFNSYITALTVVAFSQVCNLKIWAVLSNISGVLYYHKLKFYIYYYTLLRRYSIVGTLSFYCGGYFINLKPTCNKS